MTLFVSALEPSSNVHLRFLINALKKRVEVRLRGVFESDISADSALYNPSEFSVMGFSAVIQKIPFMLRAMRQMRDLALECDKILLLDSSSFHIPLAKRIKRANPHKEIIYYILPQVWAWKPWRVRILERYFDALAAILPFEVTMYRTKAVFVGHPLLDEIPRFKAGDFGEIPHDSQNLQDSKIPQIPPKSQNPHDSKVSRNPRILAFMPGSRIGEIRRIFPIFVEAKDMLQKKGDFIYRLVVPRHFANSDLSAIYGDISGFEVEFDAHKTLFESDFAFICSGTATLECALIGTPFVLGYKAKKLDAFIVAKFLRVKFVGLANILYRQIAPQSQFHIELLQDDLTAPHLIAAFESAKADEFLAKSAELRAYLGKGSVEAMCEILLKK